MKIRHLVRRSVRKHGLAKTLYLVLKTAFEALDSWNRSRFDRKYCVATREDTEAIALGIESENASLGEGYFVTPFSIIRRFINNLPEDIEKFTFIDVGSGKGRVMFYAARFGFQRILGVEYARELHNICTRNIATYTNRRRRSGPIESVHVDATQFELPDGDLAIFMFNPFREEVMRAFLAKVAAAIERNDRRIYIGYYNPRYYHLLEEADFLEPVPMETPLFHFSIKPVWPMGVFRTRPSDHAAGV